MQKNEFLNDTNYHVYYHFWFESPMLLKSFFLYKKHIKNFFWEIPHQEEAISKLFTDRTDRKGK